MASYGSTAAEPLVAKPQGASLKSAEVRRKLKFGQGRRLSEDN